MHVLDVNEIFWMPFYTYDRIIEEWGKNWPDAFALYVKLIKQSRIQQTNQTYSLNSFLKDWLKRTDERLKKSRDVLKWLWLINDVVIRDELWKLAWHYVRVNFLINEQKVRTLGTTYNLSTTGLNPCVDTSTSGQTDTNALSNININAWSNKKENSSGQTKSLSLNKNLSARLTNICKGDLTFTENVIERLEEYNNTRKKDKKLEKLTDKWFKLVIDKLVELWHGTEDWMIAVLKQSVEKWWEWLFEVKGYKPKVDYENNLQLFLTRLKTDYEWLKKELGNDKFFELKKKALEYWAVNKLL